MNAEASTSSLTAKAARGGVWILALKFAVQGMMAVKLFVLARILSPNDFGLMGVAILTITLFETFSVTGIETALIQKKEDVSGYLNTAWTIGLLRGIGLGILLLISSQLVATLFKNDEATFLLRAISLVFFFRGFLNIAVVEFNRQLNYKKIFLLGISEAVPDVIVSILLAVTLRSVWALVFGFLAGTACKVICSYLLHPWRPRLGLNFAYAKDLSQFGRWVWGNTILVFLGSELDSLILSRLLGTHSLGLYQMSTRVSTYFTREISEMIAQIVFPLYSRLQDTREKLAKSFLFTSRISFVVTFPLCLSLVFFGRDVIGLLLGENWLAIAPAVRWLAIAGLFRGMAGLGGWFFYAVGRPNYNLWVTGLRTTVLFVTFIPLCVYYGIEGAAISVMLSNLALLIPLPVLLPKVSGLGYQDYLKAIAPAGIVGMFAVGISYFANTTLAFASDQVWSFLVFLMSGMLFYTFFILYSERDTIGILRKQVFKG